MSRVFSTFSCRIPASPYNTRTMACYSFSRPKIFCRINNVSSLKPIHCGYSQKKGSKLPISKEIKATGLSSFSPSNLCETSVPGNTIQRDQAFKQLIILDLNGVLVRAYPREQPINVPKGQLMLLKYKQIYVRPELPHFIDKCLESFEIGIWSCFKTENIKNILKRSIGKKRMDKLLFIWGQSWCTVQGHEYTLCGNIRPLFVKDLRHVWQAYPQYGPKNILIIDDSEYKLRSVQNVKYVCPKTYDPEDKNIDQSPFFLWNIITDHMDECNHIPGDNHNLTGTDQTHVES